MWSVKVRELGLGLYIEIPRCLDSNTKQKGKKNKSFRDTE